MWLTATIGVMAFMIRPFGAMTIAGCMGAILISDSGLFGKSRLDIARLLAMLAPFAVALAVCALIWIWLTVLGPKPWDLQRDENHFANIFMVSPAIYLRAGVLGPLLYLGTVLAPLALLQLATPRWRTAVMVGGAIFGSALI